VPPIAAVARRARPSWRAAATLSTASPIRAANQSVTPGPAVGVRGANGR